MVEGWKCNEINSAVSAARDHMPEGWYYAVFDMLLLDLPYLRRLGHLPPVSGVIRHVPVKLVSTLEEVQAAEEWALDAGYEGLMLRDPHGMYKPDGRSTLKEQGLMKLKRFEDAESRVVGYEEMMHNGNDERTARGVRSTAAEGMVASGVLGALLLANGTKVGTGFDAPDRLEIWRNRDRYLGRLCKYKHFPYGAKDKPRHPVWLGWRDENDL
jgi:DNA ligase 1